MKRIIRKNTFETNSSSTHSLTFMSGEEFDKWKNGELYLGQDEDELYTKEEFDALVKSGAEKSNMTEEEFLDLPRWDNELPETFDQWRDDECLEYDIYEHTTESGDKVVAVCKYGYNG